MCNMSDLVANAVPMLHSQIVEIFVHTTNCTHIYAGRLLNKIELAQLAYNICTGPGNNACMCYMNVACKLRLK